MRDKRKITIIGTVHHYHYKWAFFSMEILKRLIEEINPDILCAELSPEQLEGTVTCKSKPEYPEVIIPVAREKGYKIVPIQPDTAYGMHWEREKNKEIQMIKDSLIGKWKLMLYQAICILIWVISSINLKILQSNAIDALYRVQYGVFRRFFPRWQKYHVDWNRHFYNRIMDTIISNPNKNILITVGLTHKYWLKREFKKKGIILGNYTNNIV